jgi:hypothetical protein
MSFLALVSASPSADEPTSKTIAALVETDLLNPTEQQAAESVLTYFQGERTKVTGAFRKVAIGPRVLLSLMDFETTVDIRMDFEKEQIGLAVPVVLAHIDTDAAHVELWFQMSKTQVEKMYEDLKKVLARIEQAENWTQSRS